LHPNDQANAGSRRTPERHRRAGLDFMFEPLSEYYRTCTLSRQGAKTLDVRTSGREPKMRVALVGSLIITVVAVGVIVFGIWWVHATPQPMTIEQCGTALAASTEFQKFVANMDEANRAAAHETASMRCVLDHDPETVSWSEEKKLAIITRAYCSKQASGNYLAQVFCEQLMDKESKRYKEYGSESIIIPKSIR
jgi:hypothetical protein